jgi:hypothetical protein
MMSNELLPLLDILPGPPNNADPEETFVAALNGGGDGLLRHDSSADPSPNGSPNPSHGPSLDGPSLDGPSLDGPSPDRSPHSPPQTNGAATAANHRDAATAHDSPAPLSNGLSDGLARVAATIKQIESVLKANSALALEVHFAIERIQDVAMALRMRQVDTALCDTLETSIREVGDAIVRNDAAAARTQSAAALLGDLGKRIDQMLPPVSIAAVNPVVAEGANRANGANAANRANGAGEGPSVAVNSDHATKPNGAGAAPLTAAVDAVVSDDDHAHPLPQPAFVHPALPEMQLSADANQHPARPVQPVVLSMPSPVGEDEEAASSDEPVDQPAAEWEPQSAAELIGDGMPAAASHDAESVGPATTSVPSVAETNEAMPPAAESNGVAPANSRTSANDPLAAIYGLSEEELIALFS